MDFILKNTTTSFRPEVQIQPNCINKSLFELHSQSIINFTQYDYIRLKDKEITFYEILLKIVLCLISISASLFGNIMVIYSTLNKSNRNYSTGKNENNNACNGYSRNYTCSFNYDYYFNQSRDSIYYLKAINGNQTNTNCSNMNKYQNIVIENEFSSRPKDKRFIITRIYKPYQNKPVNYFILNLCFCDLMIVVWCSWVHMVNSISENWKMGAFFCKFNTFVQVMSLIAAISTLSVISFERFKAIVFTMKKKLDRRDSIQMIIIIWIFSIVAAFPIFLYRKQYKRIWKNHVEIWCSDAWPSYYKFKENTQCVIEVYEPLRQIYYTFISLVLFFIPIIIMLFSYCLIIRKLSRTKILKYLSENSSEKNLLNKRRQKVNILLIGLLVSFTVCWSPVQGFILYEAYKKFNGREMPVWFNWFYFLVYLLAYSNSAINPIIYTGLNKFYGQELRKIINNFVGKRRNTTINLFEKNQKDIKLNSYG